MTHYGRRLKELIEWKGENKSAIADAIGIQRTYLYRQFKERFPDLKVCCDSLEYMRLPISALFSERDLSPLEVDILGAVRKMPEEKQRALLDLIKADDPS